MELHLSGHVHLEAGASVKFFNNGFSLFKLLLRSVFILNNVSEKQVHHSLYFEKMIGHLEIQSSSLIFCINPGKVGLGTGKMYQAFRLYGTRERGCPRRQNLVFTVNKYDA